MKLWRTYPKIASNREDVIKWCEVVSSCCFRSTFSRLIDYDGEYDSVYNIIFSPCVYLRKNINKIFVNDTIRILLEMLQSENGKRHNACIFILAHFDQPEIKNRIVEDLLFRKNENCMEHLLALLKMNDKNDIDILVQELCSGKYSDHEINLFHRIYKNMYNTEFPHKK